MQLKIPLYHIFGLLGLFWSGHMLAQSTAFSQFYAFPAAMNPAYVSTIKGAQVSTGYRRQWGAIQSGFNTKSVQAGIRSCNVPLAFGGYFNQIDEPYFGYLQQEGGMQVSTFLPIHKRFSLHGGFQAGLGSHRVNYQQLLFTGQLDPIFGVQGPPSAFFQSEGANIQTFELGAGVLGRGEIAWRNSDLPASLGLSVYHLGGSRDVSFLRAPHTQARRWTAHGSITTPVVVGPARKDALYLNWLGRFEWESALRRTSLGAIVQYDAAHVGLVYQWNRSPFTARNTNGLTFTIGADFALGGQANCSVQYAYDGSLGGLGQASTAGTHEIIATFTFPNACIFKGRNVRGRTDCYYFSGKGYRKFLN